MRILIYKIRRKKDGKFSTGGLFPSWSEVGVRWASLPQLRTHVNEAYLKNAEVYKEAEVVEIEEVVKRVVSPYEILGIPTGGSVLRKGRFYGR